jgi:hypothetical protein
MAALFVVCGILAGFATYRYGVGRGTMKRLNDTKALVPGLRKTAWRHYGVAAVFFAGVLLLLLFIAGR